MKTFEIPHASENKPQSTQENIEKIFQEKRQFLESYGEDARFTIENGDEKGIGGTFAVDIDNRRLFYTTRYFTEEGFKPEWVMKSTLHELEHLREIDEFLKRGGSKWKWKNHQRKLMSDEAYRILDNCFDDVKMDATVEQRAPFVKGASKELCLEKQFVSDDMTGLPKHLQFAYSLKREMLTGEKALLSPNVRAEFDKLRNFSQGELLDEETFDLLHIFSRPETPFEERVTFQEQYLLPILEKFKQEDEENPEFQNQNKGLEYEGDEEEGEGQGGNSESSQSGGENGENLDSEQDTENRQSEGESGEGEEQNQNGENDGDATEGSNESGQEGSKGQNSQKPDFGKYYKKYWEDNPSTLNIPPEQMEKLVDTMIEQIQEENKTPEERGFEAYAKKEGVNPQDLRQYREWKKKELNTIVDKETGNLAIEELREQFKRIVSERKTLSQTPIFPQDEGDLLVLPAEAYVELRGGELKPKVWEEIDTREKKEKKVSAFDIHLVCDTSGSMEGEKLIEQRKAALLLLEAMQELYEELELEERNIDEPLSIRTECLTFGSDVSYLKNLGVGLSEKERVAMYKALSEAPGSTADYLALQSINNAMDKETKEEIENGDRQKLVIVMTDGGSDNPNMLKSELKKLRDTGAIVVGVAITDSAKSAIKLYDPQSELAQKADDLPLVFKNILDTHLESV